MYDDAGAFVPGSPEPDRGHRHRRTDARALCERRESNPEMTPFGAQPSLLTPKLGVAREFQRFVHVRGIVTRIEREPGGQLMRHGGSGDEIHPPHVGGIMPELSGEIVDHALDEECRLRVARPTVWTGWRTVRINTDHLGVDIRDVVRTGDRDTRVDGRHSGPHAERVRSDVREDARAESDDPAVATSGQLRVLDVITPMRRREKTLSAAFAPGTRAAVTNRHTCPEDVLRVETQFGAESTADVGDDEPEFMERKTKAVRE